MPKTDPASSRHTDTFPTADWRNISDREHFVQFYEDDRFLERSVGDFASNALAAGDAMLLVATPAHTRAIKAEIAANGLDVAAALAERRLVILDAADTLARFMVDGTPDAERFDASVGAIVRSLRADGRALRAFGEMVALLWAEGNRTGAVRLEELWNDLGRRESFALFCAYPLNAFDAESDGNPFTSICTCHTRVIPGESYSNLRESDERHRAVSQLQQKAVALGREKSRRAVVEQSLSRRERELSDFLENAVEGLHELTPDGRIAWANKAELALLGYQAGDYVGRHVSDFHADPGVAHEMLSRLRRGENVSELPARLRCRNGAIREVLLHANAYFEGDEFIHARCFTRDVTALRETERRQRELLEKERAALAAAERVSRMKDEFLAMLSHELRTPLNAILGWTQIIKNSTDDVETINEGISVIDRNVRSQAQLIEDLLDMSRIVAGKLRLELKPTELVPVFRAAIESIRPLAEAKKIRLIELYDPHVAPVMADAGRLQQVLWNLLVNAVKFTPEGGKVEVLLERMNSLLEISVNDNGQGISPEFLPHMFERFRQADSTTTRQHGGLGLGLSLVKQLVELHGGTISAKSPGLGQGASFRVTLPVPASKFSAAASPLPAPQASPGTVICPPAHLQGVKVLVVDDDSDSRELITRVLRQYHAEVFPASSAEQALDILSVHQPDVMVSDVGMPGKNGYEMMRSIRARKAAEGGRIPAVALTAFVRSEDRIRAMRAGFQLHVSKPIEPTELVITVGSLVPRRAACR